jgi:hypothetical protein
VKTTEIGGPRGYDAGKKITARKRHAMVGPKATPAGRYILDASCDAWNRLTAEPGRIASLTDFPWRVGSVSSVSPGQVLRQAGLGGL